MIGMVSIALLALACTLALMAVHQISSKRDESIARRLVQVGSGTAALAADPGAMPQSSFLSRLLAFAATLAPSSLRGQELRTLLAGAGWYGPEAVRSFVGAKILLAGLFGAAGYGLAAATFRPTTEQTLLGLLGGFIGFHIPALWLKIRTSKRRTQIQLALPDALDLLVVCVEAGLGLNAAIVRVGREISLSCPPLSQEFRLLNQEIRAGTARSEALRAFAQRVPIPDVKSLVAMFIQTDRLGTSIGRSLRVHAESLRTKRRQRAEERARKATIKLIFPLVFFIFPELMVVCLGPAGIKLFKALSEMVGQ